MEPPPAEPGARAEADPKDQATQDQVPPEPAPTTAFTGERKWAAIGLVVVLAVVLGSFFLLGVLSPYGEPVQPIQTMPVTVTHPNPPLTITSARITPTVRETEVSPSPTVTCTPAGPPGFTVGVSPAETTAPRGTTVTYHMAIAAQNCFSGNISMQLLASAFFGLKTETVDLGVQQPPYPKTIDYPFPIPDEWPPGITIDGIITSTGGGITRENRIVLHVA